MEDWGGGGGGGATQVCLDSSAPKRVEKSTPEREECLKKYISLTHGSTSIFLSYTILALANLLIFC